MVTAATGPLSGESARSAEIGLTTGDFVFAGSGFDATSRWTS